MNSMQHAIRFRLKGKFGHFARAETQTTVLSYPVPPRTFLLGLAGAILGLEKDTPQRVLEPCQIAVSGMSLRSHWHTAKLRKDPPEELSFKIKSQLSARTTTQSEKASLITQEWLWHPAFTVWMMLPQPYHDMFSERLTQRQWYFSPYLGLSEMLADIEEVENLPAEPLSASEYTVSTVLRLRTVQLNVGDALERSLGVHMLSMPRTLTAHRVFGHEQYALESHASRVKVQTDAAFLIGDDVVTFL